MREVWHRLDLAAAQPLALVLDASGDAASWATVRGVVRELLDAPGGAVPALYFLGNPAPYYAPDFVHDGDAWYRANAGRGRLLGPILEKGEVGTHTTLLVLAAAPVFDLDDWIGQPELRGAVIVRCGTREVTGGQLPEAAPAADELLRRVDNPVMAVELAGRGVIPFWWDNPAFRWDGTRLSARDVADFSLTVGFLCGFADAPRALASHRGADRRTLALAPGRTPPAPQWQPLPARETRVYRQCIIRREYTCLACGQAHPAGQLLCAANGAAGPFVYPALESLREQGFTLFRDSGRQVDYCHHACGALRLAEDAVAVRNGAAANVYRFEPARGAWRDSGTPMQPYHPLDKDTHALVL